MNILKFFTLHPFLFALYPILFFYSHNIDELALSNISLLLVILAIITLIFTLLLMPVFRNKDKTALFISISYFMFFSGGYFLQVFRLNHNNAISLACLIIVLAFIILFKIPKVSEKVSKILNAVSLLLILMVSISILSNHKSIIISDNSGLTSNKSSNSAEQAKAVNTSMDNPDIYYIILDGYTNNEILKRDFNFDNQEFLDYLEKKGFYVAENSKSNYPLTFLSLASSLNMRYVNDIAQKSNSKDKRTLYRLIKNNEVVRLLKERGYKFIHFSSGWGATENNINADANIQCGFFNEFYTILIQSTILKGSSDVRTRSREKIFCTFDSIPKVKDQIEEPKFVFAHIICPHPPFILDKNGNLLDKAQMSYKGRSWVRKELYIGQVKFVNKKLKVIIDEILTNSKRPPVIILQGDHGPSSALQSGRRWNNPTKSMMEQRLSIFNAYYFPEKKEEKLLYKSITPVNTFRIVFNTYFNASYDLLKDTNYFSSYNNPYRLKNVTWISDK